MVRVEITVPFRKCVSGVEQLACEKSLPHGLEPATLKWQPQIKARRAAPQPTAPQLEQKDNEMSKVV